MINFDKRVGPDFGADAPTYPDQKVPDWYRDAKLGFFVHWGPFSVPAWAYPHGEGVNIPVEDAYSYHQYSEWYANTVRIKGSPTWVRHQEVYGPGVTYEDLVDQWDMKRFDADTFVGKLVAAGAQYVVPLTKHHDGFCLWDTPSTPFNSVKRGPKRDIVAELHDATRKANKRFGTYYSGALDWHVGDFPPIESDRDLFLYRRNDAFYSKYVAGHVDELIQRFKPDVLWNDIDWPDGGKGNDDYALAALFQRYFEAVPEGVVNDRWGVPYHGYATREYQDNTNLTDELWESTRGLGYSFGYNQAEDESNTLSGAELVRHLVDVVSKNGNLLINVGPRADGSIPDLQQTAMTELGAWLENNGDTIYGTRPWIRAYEPLGVPRSYTASGGNVHMHVMDPSVGSAPIPVELAAAGTDLRWPGGVRAETATASDGTVEALVPDGLRSEPVATLTLPR